MCVNVVAQRLQQTRTLTLAAWGPVTLVFTNLRSDVFEALKTSKAQAGFKVKADELSMAGCVSVRGFCVETWRKSI